MKIRLVCFCFAIFTWITSPSSARIMELLSYEDLWEKSDLVVIAEPLTKTTDTSERTHFPGMGRINADGTRSKVLAIGVETHFGILAVLKGDKRLERFTLHHYREPEEPQTNALSPTISLSGPSTLSFDPKSSAPNLLLFLIKEEDGRYAPYGGQTDPAARSVFSLADPSFFFEADQTDH